MKDCDGTFRLECGVDGCDCSEFDPKEDAKACVACSHRAARHAIKPEGKLCNDFVTRVLGT